MVSELTGEGGKQQKAGISAGTSRATEKNGTTRSRRSLAQVASESLIAAGAHGSHSLGSNGTVVEENQTSIVIHRFLRGLEQPNDAVTCMAVA